jgi:hypothetical protein
MKRFIPTFLIGICALIFILLILGLVNLWSASKISKPETEIFKQSPFTLEVKDNLISLEAEQASFKEILSDLEKKTGIKVKIFDDVEDKKVTLNITDLPVYAIHTLLEKIEIKNFAVVYDSELTSKVIYILPKGKDIAEIIKGKTIIKPYKRVLSKNITYGRGRESVGYISMKDYPRRGPESFSTDAEGNLYICDTVNQRIQIFSPNGNHLYEIPLKEGMVASDIAVDDFGYIYIYDDVQGKLYQYDNKGSFLRMINVDVTRWQSRGPLHIVGDNVYIESSDQEDILVGRIVKGSLVAPTTEDFLQPLKKGIHGFSGKRYFVKLVRWEKGEIKVIDRNGAPIKTIDLPLKGIVSIKFLQEDKKGNFYIQTERIDNEKILLEVHKFNSDGIHLTTVLIPENDYSSWTVKLLSINKNEDIYQFLPAKESGRLNIFRVE